MLDFHESKGPDSHFTIVGTEVGTKRDKIGVRRETRSIPLVQDTVDLGIMVLLE